MTRRVDKTMAKHLKKRKGRTRLNLQIPADLLTWAKDFAKRRNTTVTALVVIHLQDLQDKDQEIPQI